MPFRDVVGGDITARAPQFVLAVMFEVNGSSAAAKRPLLLAKEPFVVSMELRLNAMTAKPDGARVFSSMAEAYATAKVFEQNFKAVRMGEGYGVACRAPTDPPSGWCVLAVRNGDDGVRFVRIGDVFRTGDTVRFIRDATSQEVNSHGTAREGATGVVVRARDEPHGLTVIVTHPTASVACWRDSVDDVAEVDDVGNALVRGWYITPCGSFGPPFVAVDL